MCRGIGERIDNLQLLDNRPGPSVRDDERQRIFMFRTNVNEMNVQPIDLGDEIWQGVQSCLALAPVVVRAPIACECLTGRELYALRCVRDCFPFRPLCRVYTPAQFGKFCFRKIHIKRTNCICLLAASLCSTGLSHGVLLLSSRILPSADLATIVFTSLEGRAPSVSGRDPITKRTPGALSTGQSAL